MRNFAIWRLKIGIHMHLCLCVCLCGYGKYQNPKIYREGILIYGCVCVYAWYSNTLKSYAAKRMTYRQTRIWNPSLKRQSSRKRASNKSCYELTNRLFAPPQTDILGKPYTILITAVGKLVVLLHQSTNQNAGIVCQQSTTLQFSPKSSSMHEN